MSRAQFYAARHYLRTEPSLFNPAPADAAMMSAAESTMYKPEVRSDWSRAVNMHARRVVEWVKITPRVTYGCQCASCLFTNRRARTGFDKWPSDAPKGKRASDSEYRAHVSNLWEGVHRRAIAFTPGQAPIFPSMPELFHAPASNTAFIAWNKGRKASPDETEPARPTQPGKAKPHFPAPDRERETAKIYDMGKEKAKLDKRPRGRPPVGKPYLVRLEPDQAKRAKALGDGNISAGVRKALARGST